MKSSDKLIEILQDLVDKDDIQIFDLKRNYGSNRYNEQPKWVAEGRIYKSFLRYDSVFFNGRDTVSECIKHGIQVTKENYAYYEVNTK